MKFNLHKEGFVRVATGVPHLRVGDCDYNYEHIIELWDRAAKEQVDILCLPELSITGYTCADLFLNRTLVEQAKSTLYKLTQQTLSRDTKLIIGVPMEVNGVLYNMAALIADTSLIGVVPKSYLPNYGEFYEKRWFAPASQLRCKDINFYDTMVPIVVGGIFTTPHFNFGIELCEDLWTPIPPSSIQSMRGSHITFNLSASNEVVGKHDYLVDLIKQQSARCHSAYVYSSAGFGESTTDLVFAGKGIIAENGSLMHQDNRFDIKQKLGVVDIDIERLKAERIRKSSFYEPLDSVNPSLLSDNYRPKVELTNKSVISLKRSINPHPFVPSQKDNQDRCQEIFNIQASGLAKRFLHTRAKRMVLGISGGLDSTLALLVCIKSCEILNLPASTIVGVTMPGYGTTGRTYTNALKLMATLGISTKEIDIKPACEQHFLDLQHDPAIHDVTYENTQARERTKILMNLANKENGIVIGTGDLSELALGWATYNGDHMSMYGVNSSIPKTLVRVLVEWVALHESSKEACDTLLDILDTPVSPELLPADPSGDISQKTEDIVGPYELHDFFLYYMVRLGFTPKRILILATQAYSGKYDIQTIYSWLKVFIRRFFQQQFKRSCMPDGPKVGSINLSPRGDWRMPSDASADTWLKELDLAKEQLTNQD
ncbi:MAG: NAD(+) synthase [Bacteroidales bacterium]